jgi:chromosome segregation ATPase
MSIKAARTERAPVADTTQLTTLDKENMELRRRVAATMKQLRNLQNDIAAVHANTHSQMDAACTEFADKFREVQLKNDEVTARNETVAAELLNATQVGEDGAAKVEEARQRREAAESEVAARQAEVDRRKQAIADVEAEAAEMRAAEAELSAEIRALEQDKRSGVLNLEQVRVRNAEECKELAADEAKLVEGQRRIVAIRSKVAALRNARQARASH